MTIRCMPALAVVAASLSAGATLSAQCLESTLFHPGGTVAATDQEFGAAVDVSGDDLIVGAPGSDGASSGYAIFGWDGVAWSTDHDALATATDAEDLGASAAIDGDLAAAGMPGHTGTELREGQVLTLERVAGIWQVDASPVTSPTPVEDGGFGTSVSISADVMVVGEPGAASGAGAVHVYRRVAGAWSLQETLTNAVGAAGDAFGASVGVDVGEDRETVIVGAPGQDGSGIFDNGAAHLYVWDGAAWDPRDIVTIFFENQRLGASVAVEGNHVGFGAPFWDLFGAEGGIAWYADWNGLTVEEINGWYGQPGERIGEAIAISSQKGMAGATGYSGLDGTVLEQGRVQLISKFGDEFPFQSSFYPVGGEAPDDRFGGAVAMDDLRAVVGIPGDDTTATDAGAVMVYDTTFRAWDWNDLENALDGTHGPPLLAGEGSLCGGEPMRLRLMNALQGATTFLVVGFVQLDAVFKGGVMVPDPGPPALLLPLPTGVAGDVTVGATWPGGIAGGFTFYAQHWIEDPAGPAGYAASNAVSGTTP